VFRRLDMIVKDGGEASFTFVTEPAKPRRLLIVVLWYRHQSLILPTVPKLLFRSRRQLAHLDVHPVVVKAS
jgi:hypothetical protein